MRRTSISGHVLLLSVVAAGVTAAVAAEPGLSGSGSVRVRYESLSGQSRPGFNAHEQLISVRTLLTGEYAAGPWRLGAELADSRAYLGDARSAISTNEVNALEPLQFYVALDLGTILGRGRELTMQAGRFTMNLGSRRLVSSEEYRNTANSFGGVRVDAEGRSGWSGSAFYLLPDMRLPDDLPSILDNDVEFDRESSDAVLWGARVTTSRRVRGGALELTYLQFRERDAPSRPTRDRALETWNLRWYREGPGEGWDYEFEVALQSGHASTGPLESAPARSVDAGFWHARLGYRWPLPWKPRLAFEFDRASGEGGPDRIRRYDTLLGMRRPDFAPSGLYNQVGRANIRSPGLRLEVAPDARLDCMATWRVLYLDSRTDSFSTTGVRDPAGGSGRFAGHQVDTRVRYWAIPQRLRLEFDGVWLAKGRFLRIAPNARPGDTVFASLNATVSF